MQTARKYKLFFLLLVILGYGWLCLLVRYPSLPNPNEPIQFYSMHLHSDLKRVILRALQSARSSIKLEIYGLSDPEVLKVLEKKQREGVAVSIFYDKKASPHIPKSLHAQPIPSKGLMHRKILTIDEEMLILGSSNFTTASLKIHDNLLLGIYVRDFALHEMGISYYLLPEEREKGLQELLSTLDGAKEQIQIAMFTLTHSEIVDHLIEAKQRGVHVSVALDRYSALGSSRKAKERLEEAGVELLISKQSQLLHHKWAIIDGSTFLMGSANWTKGAFTKNEDCLLILKELKPSHQKQLSQMWQAVANGAKIH